MAAGQRILDRLKKVRERASSTTDESQGVEVEENREGKAGVLPLVAFYGREPEAEELRTKMYECVERVMDLEKAGEELTRRSAAQRGYFMIEMRNALAILDANSSPIEYLVSHGDMETELDVEGMAGVRFHTAIRFRDLMDGAQVKGLKSPSLEGSGGGSMAPGAVRGYQLDCMKLMGKIRDRMPRPWLFNLLEQVVWRDEWLDIRPEWAPRAEKREALMRQRRDTIKTIHLALDHASVVMRYMTEEDFMRRWKVSDLPKEPSPAIRRRILVSRA